MLRKVGGQVSVNHSLRIGHCGSLVVHRLSGWTAGNNLITVLGNYVRYSLVGFVWTQFASI